MNPQAIIPDPDLLPLSAPVGLLKLLTGGRDTDSGVRFSGI